MVETQEKIQAELDLCPKAADGVHQYFEIKKIGKHSERQQKAIDEEQENNRTSSENWYGNHAVYLTDVQGVLVKCAVCGNAKELWEDYEAMVQS